MSCSTQQSAVTTLRNRRNEQQELVDSLPNNAGRELASEELAGIDADIADAEEALELCQAQSGPGREPAVPADHGQASTRSSCHAASSEVRHDEPYLLIATFDMTDSVNLGVVGVTFPDIDVFKIGPWLGVDGARRSTRQPPLVSNRPFWDLDSDPRPIAAPQDVIFLVAMCENDGSSPDAIRGGVRTETARRPRNEHQPELRRLRHGDDQQHDRHDRDDPLSRASIRSTSTAVNAAPGLRTGRCARGPDCDAAHGGPSASVHPIGHFEDADPTLSTECANG